MKSHKDLEKILKNAGIRKWTSFTYVRGEKSILDYVPSTSFENSMDFGDSSHTESITILDTEGKPLRKVTSSSSIRHSNGSYDNKEGESVRDALRKLRKKAHLAKYLLQIIYYEKSDRGELLREEERITLYEL